MKSIINNAFGFLKDSYGKIRVYARPKITTTEPHGGGWFKRELKFLGLLLVLISFSNFILSNNTSALFVPTLSASVNQANLQVNGNQVINSTDKTTEIPFSFTVNTNNRTGYTAILSSETENTALTNASSAVGAKIDSISADLSLNNLPNNTWGYKFGGASSYAPIPALSTPAQIMQTTGKTNGNESNQLSIGMKLADNLESGNYTNKLILSFVSNPYTMRAVMTNGPDFNIKLHSFETDTNRIKHFTKSMVAPATSMNTKNIESEDSDYEIKAWFDLITQTAYIYTEAVDLYLNKDSSFMFNNFINVTDLDMSIFRTDNVVDMHYMFGNMYWLLNLNLSSFNTSKTNDMSYMFYMSTTLRTLDVSHFDTSHVVDMKYMFGSLYWLKTIDLSSFDTSNVTDMEGMFSYTSRIEELNLSHFDTRNVTKMYNMFANSALTDLDLSGFNTKSVKNMAQMFYNMDSIENLSLTSFDTSNVTTMNGMFSHMDNLKVLDISSFDTHNVTDMGYIFAINNDESDILTTIYASDSFVTDNVINSQRAFNYRKKLRGGNGSYLTDPNMTDKSWLRIDDPANGHPGYFTRKP